MASNTSSDALGFPVRGMPKTVREKNIIFNVIKYFEDEKERHGKQKWSVRLIIHPKRKTKNAIHNQISNYDLTIDSCVYVPLLTLLPTGFYDFLGYGGGGGFLSHSPENNLKIIRLI